THGLVVVAEGAKFDVGKLEEYFKEHSEDAGFDVRTTRLGHVQRGGVPTVADRILATRLGAAAVDELAKGNSGILVGVIGGEIGEIITTPLEEVAGKHRPVDAKLLELAEVLAR
ncbi:MAG: 6-phosphofructokinase, partial [Chitinophagaceae bacterium]|nr:6-phosphofructokinase [Anaerolineae bacterium]